MIVYGIITCSYRFAMTADQRNSFEEFVLMVNFYLGMGTIPLAFVLGFYIQTVYQRWWEMWLTIPWIDKVALRLSCAIRVPPEHRVQGRNWSQGDSKTPSSQEIREMEKDVDLCRHTILRQCIATSAIVMRSVSAKVGALYPDTSALVADGLLTDEELHLMEDLSRRHLPHESDWWMCMSWALSTTYDCYEKGYISDPHILQGLVDEMMAWRLACAHMLDYSMITVPLVYQQVANLSTYLYFIFVVVGRAQFLDPSKKYSGFEIDYYIPIFSIVEFVMYFGWLQVASKMLDPYGLSKDDVSFDLHWVIHRNVEVGNTMLGPMLKTRPTLRYTTPLSGPGSKAAREGRVDTRVFKFREDVARTTPFPFPTMTRQQRVGDAKRSDSRAATDMPLPRELRSRGSTPY
mmetsp:Transcript_14014/g.27563  ORF Transcript_14014/g.27563 Transcript_14014/m.27563 type:complete len:404 (+) Transcript_14014:1-1212(+)